MFADHILCWEALKVLAWRNYLPVLGNGGVDAEDDLSYWRDHARRVLLHHWGAAACYHIGILALPLGELLYLRQNRPLLCRVHLFMGV